MFLSNVSGLLENWIYFISPALKYTVGTMVMTDVLEQTNKNPLLYCTGYKASSWGQTSRNLRHRLYSGLYISSFVCVTRILLLWKIKSIRPDRNQNLLTPHITQPWLLPVEGLAQGSKEYLVYVLTGRWTVITLIRKGRSKQGKYWANIPTSAVLSPKYHLSVCTL